MRQTKMLSSFVLLYLISVCQAATVCSSSHSAVIKSQNLTITHYVHPTVIDSSIDITLLLVATALQLTHQSVRCKACCSTNNNNINLVTFVLSIFFPPSIKLY